MKKAIFIAVLGLATSLSLSHGTGYVYFSSYYANNSSGAITTQGIFGAKNPIGTSFQADLYYALGTVSDPVNSSGFTFPTGLTDLGVFATYDNSGVAKDWYGLGYFDDPNVVTIPGYTGGPITFEVVAFNGSSYADSFDYPYSQGRSGSFTMDSIPTSAMDAHVYLGNNGAPMPNFAVAMAVPEPSSIGMIASGLILILFFSANCRRSQRQS